MTLATPLDMDIELCFVHCALESAHWQRLSAIKVELELTQAIEFGCICFIVTCSF